MSRRAIFLSLIAIHLFGCRRISGAELEAFVKTTGTATFSTSCGNALHAASEAVAIDGYKVAVTKAERGLLITAPKHAESYAYGSKTSAAVLEAAVALEVTTKAKFGKCVVAVRPKGYINSAEVDDFSWPPQYLEERVMNPFFRNMARLLNTPALQQATEPERNSEPSAKPPTKPSAPARNDRAF